MEEKIDGQKRNSRCRSLNEVINEEKRKSKHSSYSSGTSEVDCIIAETSISEAVVTSISTETFVVLEPGSTVKLSVSENKANVDDIKKPSTADAEKDNTKVDVKLIPQKEETPQAENIVNNMLSEPNTKPADAIVKAETSKKVDTNDKKTTGKSVNKESILSKAVRSKTESKKEIVAGNTQQTLTESNDDTRSNVKDETLQKGEPMTTAGEISLEPSQEAASASSDALLQSELIYSPEEVAVIAQKLTMALAKQMIEVTSNLGKEVISAANDTLTLFNGSTLELADVDYFVIYKADNPQPGDGISFIARMELGTNAITKVVPVSPTKAWVSYYGGGIKLIDTVKEAVVNKIDIPGLETIATPDETFLFTTNIKNSNVEKMHTVGEGAFGSAPIIKLSKCRIACLSMTKSGKNIMICVEKRHSFLCIPGKSEIVVQMHELNGKRRKELKPKVDGKQTPTLKGYPIVMCENVNGDICIASFSSVDHSCSVEVYDKHLERRFVYDGDKSLSPRFMCEDICTDSKGNILMLDNSLKCVHVVNTDGVLVKLITPAKYQIENPKCINIDTDGRLWIGQGPPAQMIILEYIV